MSRVAIYYRVSTTDQDPEMQIAELRAYTERRQLEIVGGFVDRASGADRSRPGLDLMMTQVRRGKVDLVLCWALDRLGRSVRHLCELAEEFEVQRVDLISLQQQLDTSTPSGRLTFHVLGAVAQFERELIRERVKAGMAAAKARGVRIGRRRIPMSKQSEARRLRRQGLSYRKIGAQLGISPATALSYAKAEAGA